MSCLDIHLGVRDISINSAIYTVNQQAWFMYHFLHWHAQQQTAAQVHAQPGAILLQPSCGGGVKANGGLCPYM